MGVQSGTNAGDILVGMVWNGLQWTIKPSPFDSVRNTATANFVQKWTGTELCNSSIYDNAGFVGINNTSPPETLDVIGKIYARD